MRHDLKRRAPIKKLIPVFKSRKALDVGLITKDASQCGVYAKHKTDPLLLVSIQSSQAIPILHNPSIRREGDPEDAACLLRCRVPSPDNSQRDLQANR